MNEYELFALGQFLNDWPERLHYQEIIGLLESGDENHDVTACELYEIYNSEDLAVFIDDLKTDLENKFIPKNN